MYRSIPDQGKRCLLCEKPIHGRADKKFCDYYCRNAYNNQKKGEANNYIRRINHALLKNRRILSSYLPESKTTIRIHREALLLSGFQFRYHTHSSIDENGGRTNFCFDYGYFLAEDDWCILLRDTTLLHADSTT